MPEKIIIVEDNDTMRLGISESLRTEGFDLLAFSNGPDALNALKNFPAEIAVVDLKMSPMDGMTLLQKIKSEYPAAEVLIISAFGSVETAVEAMQKGAADFLTKPFSPDELRIRIKNICRKLERDRQFLQLSEQYRLLADDVNTEFENIIGKSAAMKNLFALIDKISAMDSSVLITGESGTGKELIARAIHRKSSRSAQPFIKINCGALNDNLLESELFGHEKGAFTGAIRQKKGRFELADSGTLFLDEVGDVSAAMQVKLLRVLQEGEFERLGGERTLHTDVRIISATNKELPQLISDGKFREDLFYRLSVIPVQIPPLRERREDVPLLVNYFLNKLAEKSGNKLKQIQHETLQLMSDYGWPGNIRELENLVERLWVIAPSDVISSELVARQLGNTTFLHNDIHTDSLPLDEALYRFEKNLVMQAMKKSNNVKNRAAKTLGIKTSALYYKLEKFGLL